jgi:hypothetical protein
VAEIAVYLQRNEKEVLDKKVELGLAVQPSRQ